MHGDITARTVPKEVFDSTEYSESTCSETQRNKSSNNNHPDPISSVLPLSNSETVPKCFGGLNMEPTSDEGTEENGKGFAACTDDCDRTELGGAFLSSNLESFQFQSESEDFVPESFQFPCENEVKPKIVEERLPCAEIYESCSTTEPKVHCSESFSRDAFPSSDITKPKEAETPHLETRGLSERRRGHPAEGHPAPPPTASNFVTNLHFGDVTNIHHHYTSATDSRDFVGRVEDLIQHLRESAEEICLEIDPSTDDVKVSRTAKLKVSSYNGETPKQLNELGHFCHREELDAVYSSTRSDVTLEEIFNFAEVSSTHGRRSLKQRKRTSNRILVVGQAGIGKTVLTKMLTLKVLTEGLLSGCQFVFYIRFRDVEFDEDRTLLEILLSSCGCDWRHSDEDDAMLWERIKKNPHVLIVLDGLDEARGKEMLHQPSRCNPMMRNKVSTQLKSLIGGDSLPDAKVVVTSRPRDGNGLHSDHKPGTVLQVVGFDEKARKEVGRDICGERWPEVESFLHDQPHVMAICYVPVFCVLVMKVLRMNLTGGRGTTLNSLSKILITSLGNFSYSESMRESPEDLRKLTILAFKGFKRRNYMFDEGDLERAGIRGGRCQSFLSTWGSSNRVRILRVGRKSFFSHLVWQELFTAIYLLFFATQKEFEDHLDRLHKRRWEVVARCLFGICNKEVLPVLCETLGVERTPMVSRRRKLLQTRAEEALKSLSRNVVNNQNKIDRLLRVCHWFFELGERNKTAVFFPRTIILRGTIYPSDVTSLVFCLGECPYDVEINIRYPTQFVGNSMLMLFRDLSRLHVTLRHITLSRNKISDDASLAIAQCLKSPETLFVDRCELSECGIVNIMRAIKQLHQPVDEVNLTENHVTDVAAEAIGEAIIKINTIFMLKCNITPNGFRFICDGIKQRTEPLTEINLRGNHVTDDVAVYLAECIHLISRLYIHQCKVTPEGAGIISTSISRLQNHITDLYLHMNDLGDAGLEKIAGCLHKIRGELRLDKCGCTENGYELIMEAHQDALNKPDVYLGYVDGGNEEVSLTK